jgi:carotenoid cleavage dioxygenase-like enzyme
MRILLTIVIIATFVLSGQMIGSDIPWPKPQVSAELIEEVSNRPLNPKGTIPGWLSGTLVRNGPINVTVNGETNEHWFDGLAMLHAFDIHDGKVVYTNKFLRSEAYYKVFEDGTIHYLGFASDPCKIILKKNFAFFLADSPYAIRNANVNVAKIANAYVALTEIPLPVSFDLKTLDTLGVLDYHDELPKTRCWQSAHPHSDLENKNSLNYMVRYGMFSHYIIYHVDENSSERKVIAEVPVKEPSYMHSFAVTDNYVILTEFPFVVKPIDLGTKGKPFITNYSWKPELGTRFIVVDRKTGKILGKYPTRPFFAFHHGNAFEKDGSLHLDIVTYENADIITGSEFYNNRRDVLEQVAPSKLERFSLSPEKGNITSRIILDKVMEFPRINSAHDGKPYQYLYSVGFGKDALNKEDVVKSERLYKVDTANGTALEWSEANCSPGEPVFVHAPDGKTEDAGVILSVVLDHGRHTSFLLILDGETFKEIARADAPHLIPTGLHGQFF